MLGQHSPKTPLIVATKKQHFYTDYEGWVYLRETNSDSQTIFNPKGSQVHFSATDTCWEVGIERIETRVCANLQHGCDLQEQQVLNQFLYFFMYTTTQMSSRLKPSSPGTFVSYQTNLSSTRQKRPGNEATNIDRNVYVESEALHQKRYRVQVPIQGIATWAHPITGSTLKQDKQDRQISIYNPSTKTVPGTSSTNWSRIQLLLKVSTNQQCVHI